MWPALFALVTLAAPSNMERLGSDFLPCPDGTSVEREMYDPDPADRNAFVLVFKRGARILAIFDSRALTVTMASGEVVDAVTAVQRWPSPCLFPQGL